MILLSFQDKNVIDICSGDFHNVILVAADDKADKAKGKEEKSKNGKEPKDISSSSCYVNTTCSQCIKKHDGTEIEDSDDVFDKEQRNVKKEQRSVVETLLGPDVNKTVEDGSAASERKVDVSEELVKKDYSLESTDDKNESDVAKNVESDKTAVIEVKVAEKVISKTADPNVVEQGITDVSSANGKTEKEENDSLEESNQVKLEHVELRRISDKTEPKTVEDLLTASVKSDSSQVSNLSGRSLRSKSFLDETGAREYLARQFQDEEHLEDPSKKVKKQESLEAVPLTTFASNAPSSPGAYMMQTVTSLTSHVSSMTTKALGSIASVPGKFRLTGGPSEEEAKSSSETLEVSEISDLESGSTENINLETSILDFSNLTASDTSLNASQLSLPDSEMSNESGGSRESSPLKRRNQSNRLSVSKESQSIRTIEAKQENLKKRSLSLLSAEGIYFYT